MALAIVIAFSVACSRSARDVKPAATLASSPEAAGAFAQVHEKWEARKLDGPSASDFLRRFPNDGAAPLAKVYLAFALIEDGDLIRADGILATLAGLEPGATRDLATVVGARSLRLHGAPQSALDDLKQRLAQVAARARHPRSTAPGEHHDR